RRREQIAFLVDEKSVAIKCVVIASLRRRLIQRINNRANGHRERCIVAERLGRNLRQCRRAKPEDKHQSHEQAHSRVAWKFHPSVRITRLRRRAIGLWDSVPAISLAPETL